ncbi:MAG: DUF2085 domain-containing protein [Vicinamibacterales bacterium]|nr:DUF2085 domain-containing protein [Vicinamibacterales bacterium]
MAVALTLAALIWLALLGAGPGLSRHTDRAPAAVVAVTVYGIGALVCHQGPPRSLHLNGVRMPVCARCAGLYAGLALGMLAWWRARGTAAGTRLVRTPLAVLAIVALPTAVTWTTALVGVWDPGNITRAIAALPLGFIGGAIVTAVVSGELR